MIWPRLILLLQIITRFSTQARYEALSAQRPCSIAKKPLLLLLFFFQATKHRRR